MPALRQSDSLTDCWLLSGSCHSLLTHSTDRLCQCQHWDCCVCSQLSLLSLLSAVWIWADSSSQHWGRRRSNDHFNTLIGVRVWVSEVMTRTLIRDLVRLLHCIVSHIVSKLLGTDRCQACWNRWHERRTYFTKTLTKRTTNTVNYMRPTIPTIPTSIPRAKSLSWAKTLREY